MAPALMGHSARITHRYSLDGSNFESSQIRFGGDYSTNHRSGMFELVRQIPAGKAVTVLVPGAYTSSNLMFSIGMMFPVVFCC